MLRAVFISFGALAVLGFLALTMTQHFKVTSANPLTGVAAVAAGGFHTCALTTPAGGLECWGDNFFGKLGNGTTTGPEVCFSRACSTTPVDVSSLTSGVAAVAAGGIHTCALTTAGGVKCWGENFAGQLGNGTTTDSSTPVDVSGLTSGVAAIEAGGIHTCALTKAGGVKCWGYNVYGELGNGTTTGPEVCSGQACSTTPVDVSGLTSGVASVGAGPDHTCAVTTAGGLKCWGYNAFGGLGNGTTTGPELCSGLACSTTPVDVSGLSSGVAAVAAGFAHTCALTTPGGLKCWGWNTDGQLGNGTTTDSSTPVDVSGLTPGVAAVAAGGRHTCALMTAGGLECWGYNSYGQVGNGTFTNSSMPVDVSGLSSSVAAVAAGDFHTCALMTAGGLECWGHNLSGQLGNGTTADSTTPVDVSGLTPKPTPTPTAAATPPPPVGGVSLDPRAGEPWLEASESSGTKSYGFLAGAAAAVMLAVGALGAAVWYARRPRQ